jgi:hypothetical protein
VSEMSWRTHLFRRSPARGLAGIVLIVLTLLLVQAVGETALLTVLAGLVLVLTVWPFYAPVHYRLDVQGVTVDYGIWRRRWSWSRFHAYVPLADGILLTPFAHHHRLERFRAVLLSCPERVDEIRTHLPPELVPRETAAAS